MITWMNRCCNSPQRRTALLFCLFCLCVTVFSFANIRMGWLLSRLSSIQNVMNLTSSLWIQQAYAGRVVLSLLASALQPLDFLRSLLQALRWPQIGFLLIAMMFFSERPATGRMRRYRRWVWLFLITALMLMALCAILITFSYFAATTQNAVNSFVLCGRCLAGISVIMLLTSLILIPFTLYDVFLS